MSAMPWLPADHQYLPPPKIPLYGERSSRLGCRWLRPLRHRDWSRLDSQLGHQLISRVGGEMGRGGSEGGSGDCWVDECSLASWAGGGAALGQRLKARRKSC